MREPRPDPGTGANQPWSSQRSGRDLVWQFERVAARLAPSPRRSASEPLPPWRAMLLAWAAPQASEGRRASDVDVLVCSRVRSRALIARRASECPADKPLRGQFHVSLSDTDMSGVTWLASDRRRTGGRARRPLDPGVRLFAPAPHVVRELHEAPAELPRALQSQHGRLDPLEAQRLAGTSPAAARLRPRAHPPVWFSRSDDHGLPRRAVSCNSGMTIASRRNRSPRRVSPNVEEGPSAECPIVPGSTCPSPAQRGRGELGTNLGHEALVSGKDSP
jgi:hypothetical protein